MCTAVTYTTADTYFGRTLDLEYSYNETVTVTPRQFPLAFRHLPTMNSHYAIIGMATVADGYPLYYEAANEKGLGMAGLNFPNNAHYFPCEEGKDNVAPFEFIPWLLSQCATVNEARKKLSRLCLCDTPFSDAFPLSPLHWIIADKHESVTVECTLGGLRVFDNPIGVLTNNPPFDYHITHLCDFMNLSPLPPENRFGAVALEPYSKGMGAVGLPGDLSSASRFVRAAFTKLNAVSDDTEEASVSQFFHILGAVEQQRGCTRMPDGRYEITVYTSCVNLDRGIYYYTTYENRAISAVYLHHSNLDKQTLTSFPLQTEQAVYHHN